MAELDALDLAIIDLLGGDGRLPTRELGRRLGVNEATVRRRLKRLLDKNYIRVMALLDPARAPDRIDAIIGLKVELAEVDRVAEAMAALREIRYIGISTGEFDIIAEGVFASQQALHAFLTTCVGPLRGVRDSHTFLMLHVVKYGSAFEPLQGTPGLTGPAREGQPSAAAPAPDRPPTAQLARGGVSRAARAGAAPRAAVASRSRLGANEPATSRKGPTGAGPRTPPTSPTAK